MTEKEIQQHLYDTNLEVINKSTLKRVIKNVIIFALIIGFINHSFGSIALLNSLLVKAVLIAGTVKGIKIFLEHRNTCKRALSNYEGFTKENNAKEFDIESELDMDKEIVNTNELENKPKYDNVNRVQSIDEIYSNLSKEEQIAFLKRQRDLLNQKEQVEEKTYIKK